MITIHELLDSPGLSELFVAAGHGGLGREIRVISVMDAPDSYKWLKGGEFIMTTGYLFGGDTWLLEHFINNLIEAGSCGLGIKKGRFLNTIPEALIVLADRHNFPLVEIPYRFSWSEIIAVFYERLYKVPANTGKPIDPDSIEQLYSAARFGGERLMDKLTELFRLPLAIVFSDKKICTYNDMPGVNLIGKILEESPLFPENMENEIVAAGRQFLTVCRVPDRDSQTQAPEYMAILSDSRGFIVEIQKLFHLLASLGAQENANLSDKTNIYRRFILDVQSGKLTKETILAIAEFRSARETAYTGFILIKAEKPMEIYRHIGKVLKNPRLANKGRTNRYIVDNAAKKEAVVMLEFFPREGEDADKWQFMLFEEMDYCMHETETGCVGIGSFYPGLEDAEAAYRESRESCEIGRVLWADRNCFFHPMISAYNFLSRAELSQINVSYIHTLDGSQTGLSFDGVETLEAYIECGGYKKAAARLFIHENTLRYRVQKIGDFLHVNMEDPVVCHNLIIQIKLWKWMKGELYAKR